jgi:uncharacterized protein YecE (DUF72 family)
VRTRSDPVQVGCSGWDYPAWRGRFYPADLAEDRWFEWYASRFDTVELNATFYRLPSSVTVERWASRAPQGFTYAVKVGQFGSHRKKLRDPDQWLPTHVERMAPLGDALGPNLVQLPPRWHRNVERLDEFLHTAGQMPTPSDGRAIRWAIELRDRSWLHDDVFETLRRHGAALCIHDLLDGHPWDLTTDWTYLRFHGPHATDAPYRGRYTGRRLHAVADRIEAWLDRGIDVCAYFNNDDQAFATRDATWLRDRLRGASA